MDKCDFCFGEVNLRYAIQFRPSCLGLECKIVCCQRCLLLALLASDAGEEDIVMRSKPKCPKCGTIHKTATK